ncbi:amidohydrolase [Tomitella fengzijianii]|uniref:amidohydrolase n=1 Tax=Tomitella fengzijianii TaxID=2597660 RepID=UPI00131EB308|nr:amidohydrolase [Tomitella fengzijianii]
MAASLITAERIVSMDPGVGEPEAVLVEDGRIAAAGTLAEVEQRTPREVRRYDFPGASLTPGLVESHIHPVTTGLAALWADCRPESCRTIGRITDTLRAHRPGADGWIRGWGYDDTLLAEQRHPTRDDLDAVSTDKPVLLTHSSGHFAVANSTALALAGIDERNVAHGDTRFPRGTDGRLSGLAWEIDAVKRLTAAVPPATKADLREAILRALGTARRSGITAVHDLAIGGYGGEEEATVYRELDAEGRLPVRVTGYLRGHLALAAVDRGLHVFDSGRPLRGGPGSADGRETVGSRFRLAGAKLWADGSIQGLSAALRVPYLCDAHCGDLLHPQDELDAIVQRLHRAGAQVAVHANGDAAVTAATTALRRAQDGDGRIARHRIEHCQVTKTADLDAIAAARLAVSFFVNHVYFWGDRHRDRFLGRERAQFLDPLAAADAAGLRYGLHSDCPVTPMDPLRTIAIAVQRTTSSGAALGADQRIPVLRALRAMTLDSAFLVHDEGRTGSITPGKLADLTLIDGPVDRLADGSTVSPAPVAVMVDGEWDSGF